MRPFTLLRRAGRPPSPWKNRGGVTWTITMDPPGGSMEDFSWRLSVAQVEVAGPFSHFVEVDRILALVEGRLSLRIDGTEHSLSAENGVLAFAGEDAGWGSPEGGTALGLNLMLRRERCGGSIRRLTAMGKHDVRPDLALGLTIVMLFTGRGVVEDDEGAVDVGYLDAIQVAQEDFGSLRIASASPVYWIEIQDLALEVLHGVTRTAGLERSRS